MKYFKQLDLPVYENLLEELTKIVPDWEKSFQTGLTAPPGYTHDQTFGNGSLLVTRGLVNGKVVAKKRETPLIESDFTELCDIYKGTVFEDLVNDIWKHYDTGRIRIFNLLPFKCLSWHKDTEKRIHYVIKAGHGAFTVIEDEIMSFEENTWWHIDTTKEHTSFNGGKFSRIHLVACLVDR